MQENISLVIDSNWWISLILSKYKSPLVHLFKTEQFIVYRCQELTDELCNVLLKDKFRNIITPEVFDDFFKRYELSTRLIVVTSEVQVCRDPKDDYLLSLCKDANANFLITGDKDLLELRRFEQTIICSLPDFINYHLPNGKKK